MSASLVCDNNTAAVSWQPSAGALYYTATALGRDGDIKNCTTNGTSCYLPNMHCGETYVITVSPFSSQCKGHDSYPYTYMAGEEHHITDFNICSKVQLYCIKNCSL